MKYHVLTLYKDFIESYKQTGVIGRGVKSGAIDIDAVDIRDYTLDKHGCVDDYPYGGGSGMLMMAQPVCDAVEAVKGDKDIPVIFFTPRGKIFTTEDAKRYAEEYDEVILLCGHFEGIDERAIEICVDEEVSMGEYIVTGGHIPALCFIDSVSRYIKGVLGNDESAGEESFETGLLEHEQYTRPSEFRGMKVPPVFLSGHHKNIQEYKKERSLAVTKEKRPDLYAKYMDKQKK